MDPFCSAGYLYANHQISAALPLTASSPETKPAIAASSLAKQAGQGADCAAQSLINGAISGIQAA